MSDEVQKAFDFAADLAKQLITLSTAIIGAIVTFFNSDKNTLGLHGGLLMLGLLIFVVSIGAGILSLMALTGTLAKNGPTANPYAPNISRWASTQILTFVIALLVIIASATI